MFLQADIRPAALARSVIQTPLSASQLNRQNLGVVHLVEVCSELVQQLDAQKLILWSLLPSLESCTCPQL